MKAARHIAAMAMACALALPAAAADSQGSFALRGFGAQTCGTANDLIARDEAAAANALAWLLGYMTAINRAQADTFDVSPVADGAAMLHMVVGLCGEDRSARVESVVFELLRTLAAARVRESSPLVETTADGARAGIRRETLAEVQTRLIARGHLAGEADGLYGPQTRRALRAFQQAEDLPETGLPDALTVVRLLVELPAPGAAD